MLTLSQLILRLVLAAILGSIVGLERQRLDWAAGLRTHMMVCVGSALAIIVSAYGFNDVLVPGKVVLDPSRVAAQVVSGIGFLGAGTILFLRHEVIRGLTTAAGLWTVACVGLAVGSGLYAAAIIATVLALIILGLLKPLEKYLFSRRQQRVITLVINRQQTSLELIEQAVNKEKLDLTQLIVQRGDQPNEDYVKIMLGHTTSKEKVTLLADRFRSLAGIKEINYLSDKASRETLE
jgi:putative Mg2+ transporter-C (MgtC) family protein